MLPGSCPRHETPSRLFEKGFDTIEIMTITGHKTLQMNVGKVHASSGRGFGKKGEIVKKNMVLTSFIL